MTLTLAQEASLLHSVEMSLIDPQATAEYVDGLYEGLENAAQHLEALAGSWFEKLLIRFRPGYALRRIATSLREARPA